MHNISLQTHKRCELIDITSRINEIIAKENFRDGLLLVFVPHTTAAVTINENADPDVCHDILLTLEELIPHVRKDYRHGEGNSDAHVKASLFGSSETILVENGRLCLGTWQGIYFCEFDGPRTRMVNIKTVS
jgi:secondary thiamine-phosphate synthase enzyme